MGVGGRGGGRLCERERGVKTDKKKLHIYFVYLF